uniref:Uncharacterized protein n=1 Tax=Oryza barthii TaxID=65489 RepID=A0A0D3FBG8_9ORYZ
MRSRLTPSAAIAAIAAFSGDMKSKPTQSVVSGHSSLNDPSSADGGSARCLRLFRLAGWLVTFSSSHALPLTPTVTARGCSVARAVGTTAAAAVAASTGCTVRALLPAAHHRAAAFQPVQQTRDLLCSATSPMTMAKGNTKSPNIDSCETSGRRTLVILRLRATATQLGDAALFDRPEPKG